MGLFRARIRDMNDETDMMQGGVLSGLRYRRDGSRRRLFRLRRTYTLRRVIGFLLALAMLHGLYWLIMVSAPMEPLRVLASENLLPLWEKTMSVASDPEGIDWNALIVKWAIILLPHLGLVMWFIDDINGRH